MKETRRLDVLAIIGGVLALGCVVLVSASVYEFQRFTRLVEYPDEAVPAILANAHQSDLRADLEIMLSKRGYSSKPDAAKIKKALQKYPNSPRLNLRLGTYGEEPLASAAFRRLSELDPDNALPLYLLASKAASKGSWNEVQELVRRANGLPRLDPYKFPYSLARGDMFLEMHMHTVDTGINTRLAGLSRNSGKYALKLHAQGKDVEALAYLADVRQLGRRLMRRDGADMLDALVGSTIVRNCNRTVAQIASGTGNEKLLARIEAENNLRTQIRAGCRQYTDIFVDNMLSRMKKFGALSFSLYGLVHLSLATLVGLVGLRGLTRKSKRIPVSDLHLQATSAVFTSERLLTVYALTLLACGSSTLLLASMRDALSPVSIAMLSIGILLPLAVPVWMGERVKGEYRTTYNRLAEQSGVEVLPKRRKLMSVQDKREMDRRLMGLDGGFVITLAIWALLVSIGVKAHFNAYPWQITKAMGGMPQAEMKYVKDLVDGKVKVPQKYIDEIKREEARSPKRPGGSK